MPPSRLNVFNRQLVKYALIRSWTVIIVGGESAVAEFSFPTIAAEVRSVTPRCRGESPISFAPVVAGTRELANYLHLLY